MKKKLLSILLSLSLISGQTLIINAEETVVTGNADSIANPAKCTVTATVESHYTVIVPKELELTKNDDNSYRSIYQVKVEGDIAEDEYVRVVPENEIMLSTKGKDSVPIVVTQEIQNFMSTYYNGELLAEPTTVKLGETNIAEGSLNVKENYELSAGEWYGTLMFNIGLKSTLEASIEAGAYDSSGVQLANWDELVAMGFDIDNTSDSNNFKTTMDSNTARLANTVKVVIPNTVDTIGSSAFASCDTLTSVIIPESVTSIGDAVFKDCISLENANIPSSVTSIGEEVFCGCNQISSIMIPQGTSTIDFGSFAGCEALTSIIIPNSVTTIGEDAFSGCTNLTSVTIPSSVTRIESGAFFGCSSLKNVNIPNSVTEMGDYVFECCESLESIVIPEGVTEVGECMFWACTNLKSVTLPSNITEIKTCTFLECPSLEEIHIPANVKSIGESAFDSCTELKSIHLSDSVETLGSYAIAKCPNLTSITIPKSVKDIGYAALAYNTNLTTINYTGTEAEWNAITKGEFWNHDSPITTINFEYTE
jgi:hypothetical protein